MCSDSSDSEEGNKVVQAQSKPAPVVILAPAAEVKKTQPVLDLEVRSLYLFKLDYNNRWSAAASFCTHPFKEVAPGEMWEGAKVGGAADEDDDDEVMGPLPKPKESALDAKRLQTNILSSSLHSMIYKIFILNLVSYGGALLPGEGSAIAQYVQSVSTSAVHYICLFILSHLNMLTVYYICLFILSHFKHVSSILYLFIYFITFEYVNSVLYLFIYFITL